MKFLTPLVLAAVLGMLVLMPPGRAHAAISCPPQDTAGFPLGTHSDSGGTLFCSYPAVPGENPNDFFCTYSDATGNLVQDNDAGFCPATAQGTPGGGVPDLTVAKTHSGNFTQGQTGATYTISVHNGGTAATTGMVTMNDALPTGLTPTAATGTGWGTGTNACAISGQTVTCTRSDALGAGSNYPTITVTVNVATNAPNAVTNTANVSGGGETNTANDSSSDPTTINPAADTTPPSCVLTGVVAGPPKQIQITVQDLGSGLNSVQVTASTNATVAVPAFTPGTTSPLVVTATKIDQTQGAEVGLQVTDVAGNVTNCDPVDLTVSRSTGAPTGTTVTHVTQQEQTVTIRNGTPGLTNISISVNGTNFEVAGLKDGDKRNVDISSALQSGSNNTVVLMPKGTPGGSADITIH
jgi:Domain of unknown function DUF11